MNGTLVASRAFAAPIGVSTGALRIGGNNIWPEWFKGQIDEVRIYSRALSAAEVVLDRDTPIAPSPNPLGTRDKAQPGPARTLPPASLGRTSHVVTIVRHGEVAEWTKAAPC